MSLVNIAPVPASTTATASSCTGTVTFANSTGTVIGKAMRSPSAAADRHRGVTATPASSYRRSRRNPGQRAADHHPTGDHALFAGIFAATYDTGSGVTHLFLGNDLYLLRTTPVIPNRWRYQQFARSISRNRRHSEFHRLQHPRRPAGLGGLLESIGQPQKNRLAPGRSEKRHSHRQSVHQPGRHRNMRITRYCRGRRASARVVISRDPIDQPRRSRGGRDDRVHLMLLQHRIDTFRARQAVIAG